MAARLNARHQDFVRDKIKTSQLINRLQDQADGTVELSPMQMKAIEILLKKSLPDLSAVEHSGNVGNKSLTEMSIDELKAYIAESRAVIGSSFAGDDEAAGSDPESTQVH